MKFLSTCVFASAMALLAVRAGATGDAIRQFDFGAFHRCVLTGDGAVQCQGESNVFGQIGTGKLGDQSAARPVTVIAHGASKVVTGSFYSCAIVGSALRCWGDIGGKDPAKPRTLISSGVTDAAAGDDRVCAIVGDAAQCVGTAVGSGANEYHALHPVPYTEVEHGVRAIAAGRTHACAVSGDALLCWGEVPFDASDRGERLTRTATPVRVIEHGVTGVAAGDQHDCAIVDGALWCWGDNLYGQVGAGVDAEHAKTSAQMPAANTVGRFDDGPQHCFAQVGRVEQCWVSRPLRVIEHGVTRVIAKGNATCALVDAALYCWGNNVFGQLGFASSNGYEAAPQRVLDGDIGAVAIGDGRVCALRNGALQCTRRCERSDGSHCIPPDPGFDAHDPAFGVSESEARLGVWRGTLGTQAIMLCLQRGAINDSSYYYARHRVTIPLHSDDTIRNDRWHEGASDTDASGSWELDVAQGERMSGTWSSPDGARTLPIRLTRVPTSDDPGTACRFEGTASMAYNGPRVDAEKLTTTIAADQTRSVRAFGDKLSIVELPDEVPNAARFNSAMRTWLREQIVAYHDCAVMTSGRDVDFRQQREIELRAGNWLVVRESYESDCGGAHPNGGVAGYQTWNLDAGSVVEPWTWIRASKVKCDYSSDCGYAAPEKLNALIIAKADRNKDGDECADAVNENHGYLLRPSKTGLVFSTNFAHVIQACDEDIEVSYAELAPFLTATGKADLKSLTDAASDH